MMKTHDAAICALLSEREALLEKVRVDTKAARKIEIALLNIAIDQYGKESEPLDGMTVELREIMLGDTVCDKSEIGRCVHGHPQRSIVSLAYQRGEKQTGDNACIFCGEDY